MVRRFVTDHCAALGAEYEEDFRRDLLRMLFEVRQRERGRERAPIQIQYTPDATDFENTLAIGRELEALRKVAAAAGAHVDSIETLAKHGRASGDEIALVKAVKEWRCTANATSKKGE